MVYNMGSGILRAVGDSRRPLYILILCAVTNIVLDLAFVVYLGAGVEGVAYATIISQWFPQSWFGDPDKGTKRLQAGVEGS